MSARGIRVNNNGATLSGAVWTSADFLSLETHDCAICLWVSMAGVAGGSNTDGQFVFALCASALGLYVSGGIDVYATDANSASPFTMVGRVHNGGGVDDKSVGSMATGENWFVAMSWSQATQIASFFWAKDGDPALSTITATRAMSGSQNLDSIAFGYIPEGDNAGSNLTFTAARFWPDHTLNSAGFLAEMKSATIVDTTGSYSSWPMLNAADTSDTHGGRTLTITGSPTDGTMDPADIGSPATRRIFMIS